MENINEKEKALSFADILSILRGGIVWIITITFICLVIGGVYAFCFKATTYTAKVDAVIFTHTYETSTGEQQEISEMTSYQYSALLVPQCKPVFTSNEIITAVKDAGILVNAGSVNFITEEGSPYFSITYSYSEHGGNVNEIKTKVAKLLDDYVQKSIEIIDEDTATYRYLSNKITVYSDASVTASTGKAGVLIVSILIGLVLSVVFVLIKSTFDDTIVKKEQIEQITNNQIIAVIDISCNANELPSKSSAVRSEEVK